MATTVQTPEQKSLEQPDETRSFPKGRLDVVTVGGTAMGRATFQPGWKWSESVKPIAQTESCQAAHLGYVIAGRMTAMMDDGTMLYFKAGDAMSLPPGHDAWVEGSEPCTVIDFVGFTDYAKSK
ncbi:MAG: cupin domain-containing protein [Vulcanimicrobiaceae bacterium]